jgi:hypothetical protein
MDGILNASDMVISKNGIENRPGFISL